MWSAYGRSSHYRIPGISSPLSSQIFNTVAENTTGHKLFCAETIPPPIPERPLSMQVDIGSNNLNTHSVSRNIEPPPIPQRSHMVSMQTSKKNENEKQTPPSNVTSHGEERLEKAPIEQHNTEIKQAVVVQNEKEPVIQPMILDTVPAKLEEPKNLDEKNESVLMSDNSPKDLRQEGFAMIMDVASSTNTSKTRHLQRTWQQLQQLTKQRAATEPESSHG